MRLITALCLALFTSAASPAPHQGFDSSQALDQQMAATLQSLSAGNLAEARILSRQMALRFPTSALAQLLSAELAATAAHRDVLAAGAQPMSQTLMALLLEARARLHGGPVTRGAQLMDELPSEIIQLGKDVSALLVVDLANSTLHHLAVNDGFPTLLRQHYVGSGKAGFGKRVEGDNKTPLGIYTITGQRSDASLPDLYGSGALTLDYPNALDRHLGRTGSGIWLHGVPRDQQSRPPRSSEGCVTMSNDHFTLLQNGLSIGKALPQARSGLPGGQPLVVLTYATRWQLASDREAEREYFQNLFVRYQQAWRERDEIDLLALYESTTVARDRLDQIELHDASSPSPLDAVNRQDISIFRNPSLQVGDARLDRPFVIMRAQIGPKYANQLTLYWAQDSDGDWQVVTEHWNVSEH
ncbi:MAG: L,D-transpeptidase [Granulosicoccus sp.]|nr:L,D-transpeptidase [Granulosicoccus sp.]